MDDVTAVERHQLDVRGLEVHAVDRDERRSGRAERVQTMQWSETMLRTAEIATHFTRPPPYDGPDGVWNVLDQVFVSRGLVADSGLSWLRGSTAVVREPFMLAADGTPRGFFERGVKPRDQDLARTGFSVVRYEAHSVGFASAGRTLTVAGMDCMKAEVERESTLLVADSI